MKCDLNSNQKILPGWDGKFRHNWKSYSKEQIKDLYDIVHQKVWKRSFNKKDILWLIYRCDGWPNLSVLDVGCAVGQMGAFLYKLGLRQYWGLDVSDIATQKAEEKLSSLAWDDLEFITSYVEDLEIDKTFDMVLCSHTLEHVIDLQLAVENMKRIAKKYLAIVVPMQMKVGGKGYHTQLFPDISHLVDAIGLDEYQVNIRIPSRGRRILRYFGYVN